MYNVYVALCGSSYEAQPVALADVDVTTVVDVADLTVADAAAYFAQIAAKMHQIRCSRLESC